MPIDLFGQSSRNRTPSLQLNLLYEKFCKAKRSDISEHLPTLRELAAECDHVTEFGVRGGISTTALLAAQPLDLVSYDIDECRAARDMLEPVVGNTCFSFIRGNTLEVVIAPTDFLFVDSKHTYEQCNAELLRHADKVRKIIAFHDYVTFGERGYDKRKHDCEGIKRAIGEWLIRDPAWQVSHLYENQNGLLVCRRR